MNKLKMVVTVVLSSFVMEASYNYETRTDVVLEDPIDEVQESVFKNIETPELSDEFEKSFAPTNSPAYYAVPRRVWGSKAKPKKRDKYIQKVAVIKIIDGDTFKVVFENGSTNNIRLARVDCAETSLRAKLFKDCYRQKNTAQYQLDMGRLAKQTVESWNITNLWIMHDSTKNVDRWSRELFFCFLNNKTNIYASLNYILLKQGLGKHDYKQIPYPTQKIKQAMDFAELEARKIEPSDDQRLYTLQDVNKLIIKALKNQEKRFINQLKEIQKTNE